MGRQGNIFFLTPSIFEGGRASIYTRWFSGLASVNIMGESRERRKEQSGGSLDTRK